MTQGLSISVPSWGGRGMADAELSNLGLVGGDMDGTKTKMSGTGLDELNVVCRVE